MGVAMRVFLINEDDTFKRISMALYKRLTDQDPKATLPEYRNSRIRCAEIIVELENRVPVTVNRAIYSFLQFDAEGRIDKAYLEEVGRVIAEMMSAFSSFGEPDNVIHASSKFARKRFQDEFCWEPSKELELVLFEEALK